MAVDMECVLERTTELGLLNGGGGGKGKGVASDPI